MRRCYFIPIILLLCINPCITARLIKGRATSTSTQVATPSTPPPQKTLPAEALAKEGVIPPATPAALPATTYKQLRDVIKTMQPEEVIGKDGKLTQFFISFVKDNAQKSHLSPMLVEALLQTGRDMHAHFSGNDTTDLVLLKANAQQIQDIVTSLQPVTVSPPQKQSPQAQGIAALQNLRKQTASKPITDFYAQGKVNETWLAQALQRVRNNVPLTTQNKMQIQGEMVGSATELIRELMSKHTTPSQQWKTIIDDVEKQVIAFMDKQPLQDQKPQQIQPSVPKPKEVVKTIATREELVDAGLSALRNFRLETARIVQTNPTYFYENGAVQSGWLQQALRHILMNGQLTLDQSNKRQIQGEITNTVFELMNQLLRNYLITQQDKDVLKERARLQVEQFINTHMAPQPQKPQQPIPSAPKPKGAVSQPPAAQPKKPVSEPRPKLTQPSEPVAQRLRWLSPQDTVVTNEFEIELLHYIFTHQDADEKEILDHFTKQLSAAIPNKNAIIATMRSIIQKTFQEPEQPVTPPALSPAPQKLPAILPNWINPDTYDLISDGFIHEILNFFTQHMDADNETIFNHFKKQLPENLPRKEIVEAQMKAIIEKAFS